jgi:hypothetical protein
MDTISMLAIAEPVYGACAVYGSTGRTGAVN